MFTPDQSYSVQCNLVTVTRHSTYAPYNSGGLKMIDYETIVRALRLSWLKQIVDVECCGFWKHYLNYFLSNKGGLFSLNAIMK